MSIAENYGWHSDKPEHSHNYLLPIILGQLQKFKVTKLLDIGTGNGATLPIWLENGFDIAAMEPDKIGFEIASKNKEVDVRCLGCGDILPVDWIGKFEGIVCMEVIEHMFDPKQLTVTSYDTLKHNGIAVVTTPYHGYIKNILLALFNKWDFHHHPLWCGGHIKFWSKKTLIQLFSENGFEFIDFKGVGRTPYLWKSMVLTFRKK